MESTDSDVSKFNRTDLFWDPSFLVGPLFLDQHSCSVCSISINHHLKELLPVRVNLSELFPGREKSCAIVTGAKTMLKYKYGAKIDSHPVVLRLNNHQEVPSRSERASFGTKTTHRMINNVFWRSKKDRKRHNFQNMRGTLIMNHFANNWFPFHPGTKWMDLAGASTEFLEMRAERRHLNQSLVLQPSFMDAAFSAYTKGSKKFILYTPSTGFIGMVMLSKICNSVHGYGFTPAKNSYHPMADEHVLYHRWKHDPSATVPLYLYPDKVVKK